MTKIRITPPWEGMRTPFNALIAAKPNHPILEVFKDQKEPPGKETRWHIEVSGRVVAASSEGYKNRADAIQNLIMLEQHIKWLRENGKLV